MVRLLWLSYNSMTKLYEKTCFLIIQKIGETKNIPQCWKISFKNDTIKVQQKQLSLRGNKTNRILETNPC